MSVAVRIISGSAAAWSRIAVTMLSQIALVPLFLHYWSPEIYGVWLAIQALIVIMTMLDLGHQTYIGYELLRYARKDMLTFCKYLWSAVMMGVCIALFQILLIVVFIYAGLIPRLVGEASTAIGHVLDQNIIDAAGVVLLLQGLTWMITTTVSGFFVRALEPFGYYARLAWWGVFHLIITNTAPAIAVVLGADLQGAGIVMAITAILCYIPIYVDMFSLMRKEKIPFLKPSWKVGIRNVLLGTGVTGKLLLENARQQGVRLLLALVSNAVALAAFSTMRTGANVALQGLNTITNPLMPDLMRFLHSRDQMRSEAAFGTVWVVVVALIAPAVIFLQGIVEPLFYLWTNNRITFDPALFALLSLSVLIYAVSQPALAVVIGNNLMKAQLILSASSAILVVGGIFVLVPIMGITGAGVALVIAEIAASVGYIVYARRWLATQELLWPVKSFWRAALSVVIAGGAMFLMNAFPGAKWMICGGALILCGWNAFAYWKILPEVVRQRAHQLRKSSIAKVRNMGS